MVVRKFVTLALAFPALFLLTSDYAWAGRKQKAEKAWQKFEKEYGGTWGVTWGKKSGLPRMFGGKFGSRAGPFEGKPDEVTRVFLMTHKPLFGLDQPHVKLKLISSRESFRGETDYGYQIQHRVVYALEYKGLEVHDARISVVIDQNGKIGGVTSSAWEVGPLDVRPTLDTSSIKKRVEELADGEIEYQQEPDLRVYHEGAGRLVYWIAFRAGREYKRTIFAVLDAHDGSSIRYVDKYKEGEPGCYGKVQ